MHTCVLGPACHANVLASAGDHGFWAVGFQEAAVRLRRACDAAGVQTNPEYHLNRFLANQNCLIANPSTSNEQVQARLKKAELWHKKYASFVASGSVPSEWNTTPPGAVASVDFAQPHFPTPTPSFVDRQAKIGVAPATQPCTGPTQLECDGDEVTPVILDPRSSALAITVVGLRRMRQKCTSVTPLTPLKVSMLEYAC